MLNAQILHNNSSFHLSVEPSFSYTNGNLKEVIYRSADNNSKISLLQWDKKLFYYGTNLKTSFKNFHLDLGFASSFPNQKSGDMQDSDWQNEKDYSMKTTYSVGTNWSEKNYKAIASLSYDFKIVNVFLISPKISCEYMYDLFYRKKGSKGWYGQADGKYGSTDGKDHWWYEPEARKYPYTDSETGKTWNLAGIDYERHSFYFWLGGNIGVKIEKFRTDFGFSISPFTYFSAEDRHHTAGEDNVFHAIQKDFFSSYKFAFDFSYDISKYFVLNFNIETLLAQNIKGDFYIDWSNVTDQPSGASAFSTAGTLSFGIKIW